MYDFYENLIIHTALGIATAVIKNPKKAAALKDALFSLANAIYEGYGVTPPTPPPAA